LALATALPLTVRERKCPRLGRKLAVGRRHANQIARQTEHAIRRVGDVVLRGRKRRREAPRVCAEPKLEKSPVSVTALPLMLITGVVERDAGELEVREIVGVWSASWCR
jgi:hypothetical protein